MGMRHHASNAFARGIVLVFKTKGRHRRECNTQGRRPEVTTRQVNSKLGRVALAHVAAL